MTIERASDNPFPSVLLVEGTEPAPPASGQQRLYIDSTTHGLKLTNSAGTDTAVGGGGLAQSFVGYNTIGASVEQTTASRQYMKKVVLGANSIVLSVDAYISAQVDNFQAMGAIVLTDVSNVPTLLIGAAQTPPILLSNSTSGFPDPARWLSVPMGIYLAAGTYWIGFWFNATYYNIAYDTGADVYQTGTTTGFVAGAHASLTQTTTARKYSIRANILS